MKENANQHRFTRRSFLGLTGSAGLVGVTGCAGFPAIVSGRNLNSRICHAAIGVGGMGLADLNGLRAHRDIHIAALCDVDANHLAAAKNLCPGARIYRDAFEMMAHEGAAIDSVNVSTPDHTHAQYVLEALRRGLNVYGQKPLCHDLADCRKIRSLAAEKSAVTQMGTQIMAWECNRRTVAALKAGMIGEVCHVWLFSTRRPEPDAHYFAWPLKEDPIPATLDWKLWLGPAAYRPYAEKVYHPRMWRRWRDFGSSWLGDLALHLMSPVWSGLGLGAKAPESVVAEISDDDWTAAQREQFWPSTSHVTWRLPGVKASGMKPITVEWCDGFDNVAFRMEPKFMPPAFLQDIAALTPLGALPREGAVVDGSEGWLVATHVGKEPYLVMKDGSKAEASPFLEPSPTHWTEFIDCCLSGAKATSDFSWTTYLTEMGLMGNAAMLKPGVVLKWNSEKGVLA